MSTPEERFIAHRNRRAAQWHILYVLLGIGSAAVVVLVLAAVVHEIRPGWIWPVIAAVAAADVLIVLWMSRHPQHLENMTNEEMRRLFPHE